jgi:hypothetical protein
MRAEARLSELVVRRVLRAFGRLLIVKPVFLVLLGLLIVKPVFLV